MRQNNYISIISKCILALILSFENEEIRSICEDESYALSHFEPKIVERLKNRLADLESSVFLSEVGFGNLEIITEDDNFCYKIDLVKNEAVLIFEPIAHKKAQSSYSRRINRIKIIKIRLLNQ